MAIECNWCGALYVIGALAVGRVALAIISFIWLHFLRPKTNLAKYGASTDKAKPGSWALVTGASDGIGKGFAWVLAQKGFNVVLVARSAEKLEQVADSIKKKFSVNVKTVAANCGDASDANILRIIDSVRDCEVGVLVNNVGVNTTYPTSFLEHTDADIQSIINVNVMFHTKLTKAMLDILKRRRSVIIHLSSFSGKYPAAMMPVYSASKAFDDVFSRALAPELKEHKIDSVSVVAHYVVSAMSGFNRPKWDVPTPEVFAAATLNKLGAGSQLIPFWAHDLMARIIDLLPQDFVAQKTYGMMQAARKALIRRAQKKKEEESKKAK